MRYLFSILFKIILSLRYQVQIKGLEYINKKQKNGILFLANHPGLIDPPIVLSWLLGKFSPRPLSEQKQMRRFGMNMVEPLFKPIVIMDLLESGRKIDKEAENVLNQIVQVLKKGENVLLYPAGKIYRQNHEIIRGKKAVYQILNQIEDLQVVLVRTKGLWGSSFTFAKGTYPLIKDNVIKYFLSIILNLIFFIPKRKVTIELHEPEDIPKNNNVHVINNYLETFYNQIKESNRYVPYFFWQKTNEAILPEVSSLRVSAQNTDDVSLTVKEKIFTYLKELTEREEIDETMFLSKDLSLDSLEIMEISYWLEVQFGVIVEHPELLETVNDLILTAAGIQDYHEQTTDVEVGSEWLKELEGYHHLSGDKSKTLNDMFLEIAFKKKNNILLVDNSLKTLKYKNILILILILKKHFQKLKGQYIGIMLPASSMASILYFAVLFAGKIPVLINWTIGLTHLSDCLDDLQVEEILTSEKLLQKLSKQGIDFSSFSTHFITLEKFKSKIKLYEKISAYISVLFSFKFCFKRKVPETAAVLFTSGSESKPKIVPLTHFNIISNIKSILDVLKIKKRDRLLGILPPFHSFGLIANSIIPMCIGLKTFYHPNPTEGGTIASLIKKFQATLLFGTPTFLKNIIRNGNKEIFISLNFLVSGSERCPENVYQRIKELCENAILIEGYGITECSPVISFNPQDKVKIGSIGKVTSVMEYVIINADTNQLVKRGVTGKLLVRGPNVFGGYLHHKGKSPFVIFDNKEWFDTGDLVLEDEEGYLFFKGRLKRFVKFAGEMISLQAIEDILNKAFSTDTESINLAVSADPLDDSVILFCTNKSLSREGINKVILDSGLSALHTIKKIILIDEIPLLGSGKTNYRALKESLSS